MLYLQNIDLVQFRNYIQQTFSFNQKIVGFCGNNGIGKTNLLDAIYYLSFSKSYFARTDNSNVHHSLQGFRLHANYLLRKKEVTATCILRENNKKEFLFDNEEYKKLSEHIGKIPCVMIAPDDVEMISGSSDLRRKFLDVILSQINKNYLKNLIAYNQILQQRNSILKQQLIQQDETLFTVITDQLIQSGNFIFKIRYEFLQSFLQLVINNYNSIAPQNDSISCTYQSQLLNNNFSELLNQNRQSDLHLQRTTVGTHKDDIEFLLGESKFKTVASQGQRKSLLFALKLTEWQALKQHNGFPPILLLDDVFEKLDETRMNNLLSIVSNEENAQIFITDTHKERLTQQLERLNKEFQIIELSPN